MKKGNKSCGMPKFETVFARGEIGRLFFNPNFEWQKSKSEKKLKSVTFSKTLKKISSTVFTKNCNIAV